MSLPMTTAPAFSANRFVPAGLGAPDATLRVYLGNRPAYTFEGASDGIYPLRDGEIYQIGQACGNGWRKVFNVYAKLVFGLHEQAIWPVTQSSWQAYRDKCLLQSDSGTALVFASPDFSQSDALHILMGRTYANALEIPFALHWLTPEFAINTQHRTIVCPYFDYRQLSNIKIDFLVELIRSRGQIT